MGNPCLMKLSDAWIPLKYLHHYSFSVWKIGMVYCSCMKLSYTFVSICSEQENTFKVLQQSFNSDLITRFCKRPCLRAWTTWLAKRAFGLFWESEMEDDLPLWVLNKIRDSDGEREKIHPEFSDILPKYKLTYPFSRRDNSSMKIKTLNFQTIQIQITLL